MSNRNTQTAAEAYEASRKEIAILTDCIEMELDAVENPNWANAGDAAHIARAIRGILATLLIARSGNATHIAGVIRDILATLLIARHGIEEEEAMAMIAGHLDECRD